MLFQKPWRQAALLLAIAIPVLFANLGTARLWDEDEPIFASAAQEMYASGDWIVPRFNGQLLDHKPPAMYWMMMAGYRLFGVSELGARIGPALFGLLTVLLTWQLGRRLFSPMIGFWAGLILVTSFHFDIVSRAATPDTLLTFFSMLALYLFVAASKPRALADCASQCHPPRTPAADGTRRGCEKKGTGSEQMVANAEQTYDRDVPVPFFSQPRSVPTTLAETWIDPSWPRWAGIYAAMGVAVLVKGPIGVLLPTCAIGLFLLIAGSPRPISAVADRKQTWWNGLKQQVRDVARWFEPRHVCRTIGRMRPLTATALVLLVAGPWYAAVGWKTDGAWLRGFFGQHNLGRFLAPMEHHRGSIFYYPLAILICCFPWTIFAHYIAADSRRRVRQASQFQPALLVVCWVAVYVGFFTLAATKLPSYTLPCYPALALMAACWLESWFSKPQRSVYRWLRLAWSILALVGLSLLVVLPWVAQKFVAPELGQAWFGVAGLPLLIGAVLCWHFVRQMQPRRAAAALVLAAAAFSVLLLGVTAGQVDRFQNSAALADAVRQNSTGDAPVVRAWGYFRPSLVFYLRQPVPSLQTAAEVEHFFAEHDTNAFVLTTGARFAEIGGNLPAGVRVLDEQRWFGKDGQLVLLGRDRAVGVAAARNDSNR